MFIKWRSVRALAMQNNGLFQYIGQGVEDDRKYCFFILKHSAEQLLLKFFCQLLIFVDSICGFLDNVMECGAIIIFKSEN
jgi:hypothetical protein